MTMNASKEFSSGIKKSREKITAVVGQREPCNYSCILDDSTLSFMLPIICVIMQIFRIYEVKCQIVHSFSQNLVVLCFKFVILFVILLKTPVCYYYYFCLIFVCVRTALLECRVRNRMGPRFPTGITEIYIFGGFVAFPQCPVMSTICFFFIQYLLSPSRGFFNHQGQSKNIKIIIEGKATCRLQTKSSQ